MNSLTTRKARWLRRLSWVPRWAVVPTIHKQNVAEHSFHVICLCRWLLSTHARRNDGNFVLEVLNAAMEHDADEAQSGDIPSPHKKSEVKTRDQVEVVVKCADKLEALLFLREEQLLGNRFGLESVVDDVFVKFEKAWAAFEYESPNYGSSKPTASDVYNQTLQIVYSQANPHPAMEDEPYER